MTESLQILDTAFSEIGAGRADLPLPPPCFVSMDGEFVEYASRTMLKARFPVRKEYTNPIGTMQGGFVCAALDNVLGPLSYLAARGVCVTLDLSTQYVRGIPAGDHIVVTGTVVSRSPSHVLMKAEAVNDKGRLIATATSSALIMKE